MSRPNLSISNEGIKLIDSNQARFTLSNKDKDRALFHTGVRKRQKKEATKIVASNCGFGTLPK